MSYVLIGVDGSETALRAVDWAVRHAHPRSSAFNRTRVVVSDLAERSLPLLHAIHGLTALQLARIRAARTLCESCNGNAA